MIQLTSYVQCIKSAVVKHVIIYIYFFFIFQRPHLREIVKKNTCNKGSALGHCKASTSIENIHKDIKLATFGLCISKVFQEYHNQ